MNYITFIVLALACLHTAMPEIAVEGECNCGVFSESSSNNPLITHKLPFHVLCDETGTDACHQLCIALARGSKERGPALLCEALNKHVENLNVFIQTSACDSDKWKPTGLKLESICCHEGKVTECDTPTVITKTSLMGQQKPELSHYVEAMKMDYFYVTKESLIT